MYLEPDPSPQFSEDFGLVADQICAIGQENHSNAVAPSELIIFRKMIPNSFEKFGGILHLKL